MLRLLTTLQVEARSDRAKGKGLLAGRDGHERPWTWERFMTLAH